MTPRFATSCLLGLFVASASASAQTPLTTERVVAGLSNPVWAGSPAGDDRIFVVEQRGLIRVVEDGSIVSTFLDLTSRLSIASHGGLLGMTFHPDYRNNGHAFVVYTRSNGDTVVARWTASASNPNVASTASERVLLTVTQPAEGHDGGALAFSPRDGYLYLALGDGNDDVACNAQRLDTLLGKLLRIDVDSANPYSIPADNPYIGVPGALPEIYHIGLRQPWRISFDSLTGDMFIGDVGENEREEVSFVAADESGLNFGWPVFEGTNCVQLQSCPGGTPSCAGMLGLPSYRAPIYELFQSAPSNPRSVIGGFVYRGCLIPDLQGTYFFADYYDELIRSFRFDTGTSTVNDFQDRTAELTPRSGQTIRRIASLGEDGFGEILIVDHDSGGNGEVFKIIPTTAAPAVAAVRNGGGTNRLCYTNRSKPILGNVWRTDVDTNGHPGATLIGMQGRQSAISGVFFQGNELLVSGLRYYRVLQGPTGGVTTFEAPLPCDVSLNGAVVHNQAYILGGAGLELCNALTLTVGYY